MTTSKQAEGGVVVKKCWFQTWFEPQCDHFAFYFFPFRGGIY